MECVTGVPYTYSPDGVLISCAVPLEVSIDTLPEVLAEFLYLLPRVPTYVVAMGAVLGLFMLLAAALTVKELMS